MELHRSLSLSLVQVVDLVNFKLIFIDAKIDMCYGDFDVKVFFIANYATDDYDNYDIEYLSTQTALSLRDYMP